MKKIIGLAAFLLILSACAASPAKQAFTSIRDAFDRSLSLRCEYTDEDGATSINYIKNKMIRTESKTSTGEEMIDVVGLIRDEKIYIWGKEDAEGLMMDLSKITGDGLEMGDTRVKTIDDIISELEKNKNNCRVENIPNTNFDVPANINFRDLSSFNFGE